MARKVVVQVRLPAALVEELDKLADSGLYSDRTEAITDAVRHILERYSQADELAKLIRLYMLGKIPRTSSIEDVGVVGREEEIRDAVRNIYGTDDVDAVLDRLRGRRI